MVHAVLAARAEVIVLTQNVKQQKQKKTEAKMIKKKKRLARNTYPQLRHRLEQVKYSSGKKQLCATSSPAISPLKRSLSACREIKDQQILIHKLLSDQFKNAFPCDAETSRLLNAALPAGL